MSNNRWGKDLADLTHRRSDAEFGHTYTYVFVGVFIYIYVYIGVVTHGTPCFPREIFAYVSPHVFVPIAYMLVSTATVPLPKHGKLQNRGFSLR